MFSKYMIFTRILFILLFSANLIDFSLKYTFVYFLLFWGFIWLAHEANEKEEKKYFTIIWGFSAILYMLITGLFYAPDSINKEIADYILKAYTLISFGLFIWYHVRTKEDRFHIKKIHEHIVLRYFAKRPQNDLTSYNLFGKVKSTTQISCIGYSNSNFITHDCYVISISNFNQDGSLTVKYLYNSQCIYNSINRYTDPPESDKGNIKIMKVGSIFIHFKIISLINKRKVDT